MIKNLKKRLKDQRGLTLVELLAVIVILGIIAAIAVPSIGGIIQKSKEDAVKSDAIQILNAAKHYSASNNVSETVTLGTDEDDGDLSKLLDFKGDSYSITITPSTDGFTYTNINVVKDGLQIVNAVEADVLSEDSDIVNPTE